MNRRSFLAIAAAGAYLSGPGARVATHRFRFNALGADAEITLPGDRAGAERALHLCCQEIKYIEKNFSLWSNDSLVSRLNREGRVDGIDWRFADLVDHANEVSSISRGGFDLTVQPLWTARTKNDEAPHSLVNWRGLRVKGDRAWFEHRGMAATFNGIAQGYAADRIVSVLKQEGYRNILANLGEFRGVGSRLDGTPWRIGVANPITGLLAEEVALVDCAIATSEPYGTMVRGHTHIFDPLDRAGARWTSVTVLAEEGWRADALSTAIAAAPETASEDLLRRGNAIAAILISERGDVIRWS